MASHKKTSFGRSARLLCDLRKQIDELGLSDLVWRSAIDKLGEDEIPLICGGPHGAVGSNYFNDIAWLKITGSQKDALPSQPVAKYMAENALMTERLQREIELFWDTTKDIAFKGTHDEVTRNKAEDIHSNMLKQGIEGIRVSRPSIWRTLYNSVSGNYADRFAASAYRYSSHSCNEDMARQSLQLMRNNI